MLVGLYQKIKSNPDKLDVYEQRTTSDDFHKLRKTFLRCQILKTKPSLNLTDIKNVSKNPSELLERRESNTVHFDIFDRSNTTN